MELTPDRERHTSNLKYSSMALSLFHTGPKESENQTLFLRLGLIRHKNGGLPLGGGVPPLGVSKTPFTSKELDGKHFGNRAFRKRWRHRVFFQHKSKVTGEWCVLRFLWRSVDGKHLMRFQSEASLFRYPRCSVDGVLYWALVKRSPKLTQVENLGQLATPFGQGLRALTLTRDDFRSLWSRSNLRASQSKFFTVWPPHPSQRKLSNVH